KSAVRVRSLHAAKLLVMASRVPDRSSHVATSTFCTYDRGERCGAVWLIWPVDVGLARDRRAMECRHDRRRCVRRAVGGIRVGCFEGGYAGASITMPSARPATAMRSSYVTTARRSDVSA